MTPCSSNGSREAQPYQAPNHYDMRSLRLQGFEPGGPTQSWVGLSHFLPGGGAGPDSSPLEKVYVVLAGELTVRVGRLSPSRSGRSTAAASRAARRAKSRTSAMRWPR